MLQTNLPIKQIAILSFSTIALLFATVSCTRSPEANSISDTKENLVKTTVINESIDSGAKSKRRIDTGADIANVPLLARVGTTIMEFDIEGMTCAACAGTITNATAEIEGVTKVRISLLKNKAWVQVANHQSNPTTADKIVAAIQTAGAYEATLADAQPTTAEPNQPSGNDG